MMKGKVTEEEKRDWGRETRLRKRWRLRKGWRL